RIRFASSRCGRSPYVLRHVRSALMQACASLPCRRPHGSLNNKTTLYLFFLRKEVIQPHLPIRLPCYDFTPVTGSTFDSSLHTVGSLASGISDSHGVTGGVYKTRERIHRDILICDY